MKGYQKTGVRPGSIKLIEGLDCSGYYIARGREIGPKGLGNNSFASDAAAQAEEGANQGKNAVTPKKAENLKKADEQGIPRDQLGPSGKPKIITVKTPTRKAAEDAQQARSKGPLVRDVNPATGNTHYHPTQQNGSRRKGKQNIHIEPQSKKGRLPD